MIKGTNKFTVSGNTVTVDISTPSYPSAVMLVDLSDWEYLRSLDIGRINQNPAGYALVKVNGTKTSVHRVILRYPDEGVDHINHNGCDNRRKNLREASNAENLKNQSLDKRNSSGVSGVNWHKQYRSWVAAIGCNGKWKHLGSFDNIEDAITARLAAEVSLGYHKNHGLKR